MPTSPTDYITRADLIEFGDNLAKRIIDDITDVFKTYVGLIDERFNRLESHVGKLELRFDRFEAKVDQILVKLDDIVEVDKIQNARLNRLETKIA